MIIIFYISSVHGDEQVSSIGMRSCGMLIELVHNTQAKCLQIIKNQLYSMYVLIIFLRAMATFFTSLVELSVHVPSIWNGNKTIKICFYTN